MITKVEIKGYRLLDNFVADPGSLTVVIGANATGKSTLIDCLKFIAESVQFPLSDVAGWHLGMLSLSSAFSEKREIEWNLIFNKPKMDFFRMIPLRDDDLKYNVKIETDIYGQPRPVYEVLCYKDPLPGKKDPFKFLESSRWRSWIFDHKLNKLVDFDTATPDNKGPSPKDSSKKMEQKVEEALSEIHSPQKDFLLLAKMNFLNEYPEASAIKIMLSSFAFYPGFEVGKLSPLRTKPAEIKPMTILYQAGENLGTVLHEIFTKYDYRENAEEINEFIKSAYPYIESINPETVPGNPPGVLVRVREKNMRRAMELWDLSDGMLRFLCLAAALLNPVPPPFMAFDEPEAGLHPKLLPIVADMIKTASEKTQVLITTHSPDLLNRFEIDNIAVMTREDGQILWKRPGTRESLKKMLASVEGENLGDLHRSGELEAL